MKIFPPFLAKISVSILCYSECHTKQVESALKTHFFAYRSRRLTRAHEQWLRSRQSGLSVPMYPASLPSLLHGGPRKMCRNCGKCVCVCVCDARPPCPVNCTWHYYNDDCVCFGSLCSQSCVCTLHCA